jgi:hypothetical protein
MRALPSHRFFPALATFSTAIAFVALGASWHASPSDAPAHTRAARDSGEGGPPTLRGRSRYEKPGEQPPFFDLEVLDQPLVQRVWVDWIDSEHETYGPAVSFNSPEPGDWSALDIEASDAFIWSPESDPAMFVRVRAYFDDDAPVTATPDYVFTEFLVFDSGWTNFGSPDE